tara:strand:- start:3050 stop:4495 length:1446 start_codon:yes stop_codon:yes gene_type:complete
MADTAPAPKYRLSASTLNNMKEAAGNYMPNYGNWRFKVKPPKPEPEPEPEPDPVPPPVDPGDTPKPTLNDPLTFSEKDDWGEEGGTVNEFAKNCHNPDGSRREGHVYTNSKGNEILCAWDDSGNYDKKNDSVHDVTTKDTRGGVTRTGDIVNGEKVNVVETPYGDQEGYTPMGGSSVLKRSPYKAVEGGVSGGEADEEVAEEVPQVDPYKELMFAASNFRGATPGHHDQIKKIVGEMKNNFSGGDKQVQTEQHVELAKLGQSVKEDVGEEGLSNTIKEVVDGQLLSASTRPQEMELISRYLDRNGVQPSQTEDKQWLNLIPTRNGGTVPMSVNDMSELIAKRTIQYPIGKEFSTALGDFEKHGRQGGVWHPEDIKMQNMNLIKGNPDALASCLLDGGIFGTRPLIEKIQEVYFPDADIDLKELVYQSSQSKETYDEMVDMFAGGLERVAFERYSAGKGKFDEENKGATKELSAAELIKKYA